MLALVMWPSNVFTMAKKMKLKYTLPGLFTLAFAASITVVSVETVCATLRLPELTPLRTDFIAWKPGVDEKNNLEVQVFPSIRFHPGKQVSSSTNELGMRSPTRHTGR